jgi:formylglycine-generating enzyme required for sulfatase activity
LGKKAFLLLAFAALLFTACENPGGGGGFTPQTNTSTANDAATLGFVGTSVTSSDTSIATVKIEGGNIVITSVAEGSAVITVSADGMPATIPVTVADDGGITIGTITKGVGYKLIPVPAGSFQRDDTEGNISVITTGYRMGETEVTQELFQAVMGTNPSYYHGGSGREPADGETQNQRPVEQISWYAAIAFCNKLSLANGKEPVYSVTVSGTEVDWATLAYSDIPVSDNADWNAASWGKTKNGYRLPTEMEWMWAAMGAGKTAQPNTTGRNKTFAGSTGSNSVDDYAWYSGNSTSKTHEAGKKSANELGLKDMSGNVWEWCWDRYGSYPTEEKEDYDGAASGTYRVFRGGSWNAVASLCAVSSRGDGYPDRRDSNLGFRVACP